MSQVIQLLIYGVQLGAIYALIALGYTMVYGIVNLINFAHGDFLMIGAFTVFFAANLLNFGLVGGLIVAMLVVGAIAVTTERVAYRPMRNQPKLSALITALGVSMFIQNLLRALPFIGPTPRPFPELIKSVEVQIGSGIRVTSTQLLMITLSFVMMLVLTFVVHKTKTGRNMRAVCLDRDASALMGINVNRVIATTFFIGGVLAAAGGVFYASMYPTIDVYMGSLLGNKAFIAAVVGGIGNIKGAMWGGIIMGVAEVFATAFNSDLGYGIAYVILILILLVKPAGLFGKMTIEKV